MAGSQKRKKWYGRYSIYIASGKNGTERRQQRRVFLGLASEMRLPEAKAKLKATIQRETGLAEGFAVINRIKAARQISTNDVPRVHGHHASKGVVSEMKAILSLMADGFEIFQAVNPSSSCDLLGLKDGRTIRFEVKTGELDADGQPLCRYDRNLGKFDVLVVVTESGNVVSFGADSIRKPLSFVPDSVSVELS